MGEDTRIGPLSPHDALLLGAEGQVRPATSLTDSGTGGGVSLDYERWRGTHGVSFGIGGDQATTRGKLFPSSDGPGAYTDNTHRHFWLRLGTSSRRSLGESSVSFRELSSTHVGFGTLTDDPPARSDAEDGEIIDWPAHTYSTITIARETGGGLEFRPTPRFALLLEAGLRTSLLFDVDGRNDLEEPFAGSRLGAALFVRVRGGVGDVVDPQAKDADVGALELTNLLLAEYLLGSLNTWGQYENLQKQPAIFGEHYGGDDAGTFGAGSGIEDVGLLQGLIPFTASNNALDLAGRLSRQSGGSWASVGLPVLEGLRCAVWLGLGSGGNAEDEALIGAGLAGCARAATLGMIAGRQSANSIFLTRLGVSALMMGMGKLGQLDGDDYHAVLEGLSLAGFSTFMELWRQPDPTDGGLVRRKNIYGFSPWSLFSGNGQHGARGTITSRTDLHVLHDAMALQLSLASPLFAATNAGKRVVHEFDDTITGPLDGTGLPTTLRAELQFAGELELGGGVALRGHMGPHVLSTWKGLDSAVGLGVQTGVSLELPLGELRLGIGVSAYFSTSHAGNEMEIAPVATFRWGGNGDEDAAPTPEVAPAPAAPPRPNRFLLPPPPAPVTPPRPNRFLLPPSDPKPRVNPFLLPPKKR